MIGSIEKFNELIGNRTRDLLPCSIVPQPITVLSVPIIIIIIVVIMVVMVVLVVVVVVVVVVIMLLLLLLYFVVTDLIECYFRRKD
jgi:hypothetical protein